MIEEIEYEGIWWLPDKPEKPVSGTLKFTPDEGAILDLNGNFHELHPCKDKEAKNDGKNLEIYEMDIENLLEHEIMLGRSENSKNITLYNCWEYELNPVSSKALYRIDSVFIGAHFQKPGDIKDIKFKFVCIYYAYLDEWREQCNFDIKNIEEEKAKVEFEDKTLSLSFFQKEVEKTQQTWIRINPENSEEISFEDYRKIIYYIRNFLALGFNRSVYPLATEVLTRSKNVESSDLVVNEFFTSISIPTNFIPLYLNPGPFISLENKLTFKRFTDFLKNYFKYADILESIYYLYLGELYNPHMYLENQFLSLIQSLESFHRLTFKGKYVSDNDYDVVKEALIKAIPESVDSDLKARLKEYFKYGNEFSLRKRLKELFNEYPEFSVIFTKNKNENKKDFIEKVVNTRNYLTHYDEELKEYAVFGEDLYLLTQKLRICAGVCLLKKVGFDSEEIINYFNEFIDYNELL